ncbi:MAG: CoA-binding protein [candidate division FCPU426 bacterium]
MSDFACGLPTPAGEAASLLAGVRTIAVVGLSPTPDRPSHRIAKFLIERGYEVIPIRPATDAILGRKAYPSLTAYGQAVDVVDIFRNAEAVPAIVDEAITLGCKIVWMQEGISHPEAAQRAEAAGLKVVQNQCIYKVLSATSV